MGEWYGLDADNPANGRCAAGQHGDKPGRVRKGRAGPRDHGQAGQLEQSGWVVPAPEPGQGLGRGVDYATDRGEQAGDVARREGTDAEQLDVEHRLGDEALDGLRVARHVRAKLAGETLDAEKSTIFKGPEY